VVDPLKSIGASGIGSSEAAEIGKPVIGDVHRDPIHKNRPLTQQIPAHHHRISSRQCASSTIARYIPTDTTKLQLLSLFCIVRKHVHHWYRREHGVQRSDTRVNLVLQYGLFDLDRRLITRQTAYLTAIFEYSQRRGLAKAQSPEKILTQHFHFHFE